MLSVLYTDGGEQTSLEGCSAKVAVIDGLGSQGLLEVLVVADPKDLAKPRSKFDLAQDSVRLLVLPPEGIDACLGKGDADGVHSLKGKTGLDERKTLIETGTTLIETGTADYHRAVDSLATSVWRGLVAPKNPLDALDQPVADRIFEDIMPRTMAPAQAVQGRLRPFIKEWRSVTEQDYDLFWKLHFSPQQTDSKIREIEYDDLTALHKVVMQASAPEKSSRSKSSVVCQRVLEYTAVAVAFVAFQWWMGGNWDNVKGSLTGNGADAANGIADVPAADGLYQELATEAPGLLQKLTANFTAVAANFTPSTTADAQREFATEAMTEAVKIVRRELRSTVATSTTPVPPPVWHVGDFMHPASKIYTRGMFVDPDTEVDLLDYRPPYNECMKMLNTRGQYDFQVGRALMAGGGTIHTVCGRSTPATLLCDGLGVRNGQCFKFASGVPSWNREGSEFLWGMLERIFLRAPNEHCTMRCGLPAERVNLLPFWAREYKDVNDHLQPSLGLGDDNMGGMRNWDNKMRRMFPMETVENHKTELERMWFVKPCGRGIWTMMGDQLKPAPPGPLCMCPRFVVTCELGNDLGEMVTVSHDAGSQYRDSSYLFMQKGTVVLPKSHIPGMKIRRCFYQCLTKLFSD
ncbi:hypothetical protein GNI_162700 [Gregarina niphandrodes]|uniref:Uncharacterized protein n=1 Tax=Gregarina niphandrodes TaxID=110365 RepID=A0A023AZF2_GRENI|nr:hypothetical protein GNI_162700 [Gregarina niphandrodes]EZG43685.1 hypothetical protein GNI_162700 [Gregarina niphandrodes]|eukprot:XP_011133092.1 hypothetical protein GNI_162700 [Gregarina niphandrodes]